MRALVGLCKLGASGGNDASLRPFADGSATKLAEACRRFLINPGKDNDLRYVITYCRSSKIIKVFRKSQNCRYQGFLYCYEETWPRSSPSLTRGPRTDIPRPGNEPGTPRWEANTRKKPFEQLVNSYSENLPTYEPATLFCLLMEVFGSGSRRPKNLRTLDPKHCLELIIFFL